MMISKLSKLARESDVSALRAAMLEELDAIAPLLAGEGAPVSWEAARQRRSTLTALATFPLTDATMPVLMNLALSGSREEREAAYAAFASDLPSVPTDAAVDALASGSRDNRAAAIALLGKLRAPQTIDALSAAFAKEKVEALRAAMLRVLVSLGVPIESFLDRKTLAKEAEKVLKKGVPEVLAFLSIDTLPQVHWKDGSLLDPRVLTSWLVLAHKSKSPIASPLMVAYAAELREAEREALGRAIYERWYEEDFALHDLTAAEQERVQDFADRKSVSFDEARYRPEFKMNTMAWGYDDPTNIVQGALDHRGVLALAAALAPRFLVPECVRYVKLYRGLRIGQSRAMIHMLAGMETASATQALVAFSHRFRTASLRKEADKMVKDLAMRRGWTPEELADRTMPTAGLDDAGCLHLVFTTPPEANAAGDGEQDEEAEGEVTRRFEARLDENLELELYAVDEEGQRQRLPKLPEPRKDEDPKQAAEEKKRLAASKKELKTLLTNQRARLYEAMCSERAWSPEDFAAIYLAHPVMKHVATRLLLRVTRKNGESEVCRASGDGSYVDSSDDTIEIPDDAVLRLAHSVHLSAEEESRWTAHLSDYQVIPLFPQLGRARFVLDDSTAAFTQIPSQHTLNSFKLRGLATRLGFDRGATGDGGYVDSFEHRLPSLGMTMVIVHSALQLPDPNEDLTLEGIEFCSGEGRGHAIELGQVPEVLLSEGWNVLLTLTA